MTEAVEPINTRAPAGDHISEPPRAPAKAPLPSWIVLGVVLLAGVAYGGYYARLGFVANDDGTIAQSAMRVLQGQVPHRDFFELYTGGMSYYHAAAFRAFGTELVSLRIAVLLVFVASIPVLFYIASRVCQPVAAGAITLLAAVWGFPNYPAAMPSWYNLFFAIFGIAALCRYLETEKSRWLLLAGMAGGISFLAKVTGLYYVAAVFIFFAFREQSRSGGKQGRAISYRPLALATLCLFLALVGSTVGASMGAAGFVHFFLPALSLVFLLAWREFRLQPRSDRQRFADMARMLAPFLSGFLLPVLVFLVPFIRTGSLSAFVRGVFYRGVGASRAMEIMPPAAPVVMLFGIVLLLAVAFVCGVQPSRRNRWLVTLAAATILAAGRAYTPVARMVWFTAATLTPLIVLLGVAALARKNGGGEPAASIGDQRLALLIAAAAMCSLIQFPFPAPIYLCYFAPLLVLATCAVLARYLPDRQPYFSGVAIAFYLAFAVLTVAPSYIYDTWDLAPRIHLSATTLPRTKGMRLNPARAWVYQQAVPLILQHAPSGYLIAAPECPELYFLTGLRNPTRNDNNVDPEQFSRALADGRLNVVVINERPFFGASKLPPAFRQALEEKFPQAKTIGKFQIRWR